MVSHLSTAHCTKDCTLIRQVLNHAVDDGHLPQLPRIIRPGTIGKNPRPWLTAEEWVRLVAVAHQRIAEAQANGQTKVVEQRQDLLEFMQMMVASMCRVGELLATSGIGIATSSGTRNSSLCCSWLKSRGSAAPEQSWLRKKPPSSSSNAKPD